MSPNPVLQPANWNYPTTIWYGPGRIAELALACQTMGIKHPLLVTDKGLASLPVASQIQALLGDAGLGNALFCDIQPNPVGDNVLAGVQQYHADQHDGIIALGGGSAIDTAKAMALIANQSCSMWALEDQGEQWLQITAADIPPIIAIPTTAGTGAEVGRVAVIINEAEQRKVCLFHPRIQPALVLSDPQLCHALPPHLTAATGMDALAHCFEAWCAPGYHPMADGIALEGMRLIKQWLPVAVSQGNNTEARGHMLVAASMGATAFQKGLGAVHSLSHPVGSLYHTHHGLTNAVFLPYVMDLNRSAIEAKMLPLARYLQLPGNDASSAFTAVKQWLLQLRTQLAIPHTLAELGVDDSQAATICQMAEVDPTAETNPVPLTQANLDRTLRAALAGNC